MPAKLHVSIFVMTTATNLRELGGIIGQEDSTVRGRNAAKKIFEAYLQMRQLPSFDVLVENEDQICHQSLLKQFGSYLVDFAVSSKTASLFKGGSALQYLSSMVNLICQKWPNNINYKDQYQQLLSKKSGGSSRGPDWINAIRVGIQKDIQKRCIETGQQYAEDSPPIGRNLLLSSCTELLKQNNAASYIKRWLIITNLSAVGMHNNRLLKLFYIC